MHAARLGVVCILSAFCLCLAEEISWTCLRLLMLESFWVVWCASSGHQYSSVADGCGVN